MTTESTVVKTLQFHSIFKLRSRISEHVGLHVHINYKREKRATTLSRMDFSGYVGHVAIFSWMLTTTCCLIVGLELRLGLDLVSGWLVVMHTCLSVSLSLFFRSQSNADRAADWLVITVRQIISWNVAFRRKFRREFRNAFAQSSRRAVSDAMCRPNISWKWKTVNSKWWRNSDRISALTGRAFHIKQLKVQSVAFTMRFRETFKIGSWKISRQSNSEKGLMGAVAPVVRPICT